MYEEFKTVQEIINDIGDDYIGVDTMKDLSRLIPVGSILYFAGERVKSHRVDTVVGRGLGEVVSEFNLVYPEGAKLHPAMFEAYGLPNATLDALDKPEEAFFVQFRVRPSTLEDGSYSGIETRIVDPLTTRLLPADYGSDYFPDAIGA